MHELILVRHGKTDKNIGGALHGVNDTEDLNNRGKAQIVATAEVLRLHQPQVVISSRERRMVNSGKIIAEILGIPFKAREGLRERNWGIFTGKPFNEVKVVLDKLTLEERYIYVPPGGESWKECVERLVTALTRVFYDHPNQTVVITTHGGPIRQLMPYLLEKPPEESFKYDPANAAITIFEVLLGNKYKEITIDNTDHLPASLRNTT